MTPKLKLARKIFESRGKNCLFSATNREGQETLIYWGQTRWSSISRYYDAGSDSQPLNS